MNNVKYDNVSIADNAQVHLGDVHNVHNHYYERPREEFAILGYAASIMRCLDVLGKLVSAFTTSHGNELTMTVRDLEMSTKEIADFISLLSEPSLSSTLPAANVIMFNQITTSCKSMATELADVLNQILQTSHDQTTWAELRDAFRKSWDRRQIHSVLRRLDESRTHLTTQIMLLLNDRLATPGNSHDEILEVMAITSNSSTRQENRSAHPNTLAAIMTSRNGTCHAYTAANSSRHFSQSSLQGSAPRHTLLKFGVDETSRNMEPLSIIRHLKDDEVYEMTGAVLDALHFRSIRDRASLVAEAHRKTFQWIFKSTDHLEHLWDDFPTWLSSSSDLYWINGKAGSGKSTLMKYISQDPRLELGLKKWAGSSELIKASYFFWYAGNSLHKSQTGLIRSLLFDVLSRKPELAFLLLPDVCRGELSRRSSEALTINDIELRKTFALLPDRLPLGLKLFFFVDGIDEYEGDCMDLFDLFSLAARSPSIKIILSSRPTPICVRSFNKFPKLRLQDLTLHDVRSFTEDELMKHPVMVRMDQVQPGALTALVDNITGKASGVFLWVSLAVKRLYAGLDRYESLEALLEALYELPEDLERLYDHMLGSIDAESIKLGAQMMQMVSRSLRYGSDYPVTVLQLSYLENLSTCATRKPPKMISEDEENWRCEVTEGRMRSRCCGLLEVQELSRSTYRVKVATFLHRTVYDYLDTSHASARISSAPNMEDFDPETALVVSSLEELRVKVDSKSKYEDSYGYLCMYRTVGYLTAFESRALSWEIHLATMMDALDILWFDDSVFSSPQSQSGAIRIALDKFCRYETQNSVSRLLLSTALQCPSPQLDTSIANLLRLKLDPLSEHTGRDYHSELAARLLIIFVEESPIPLRKIAIRNLRFLCDRPEKPLNVSKLQELPLRSGWKKAMYQDVFHGWSLWRLMLHFMNLITSSESLQIHLGDSEIRFLFFRAVAQLLGRGASGQVSIPLVSPSRSRTRAFVEKLDARSIVMNAVNLSWTACKVESQEFRTTSQRRSMKHDKIAAARLFKEIEHRIRASAGTSILKSPDGPTSEFRSISPWSQYLRDLADLGELGGEQTLANDPAVITPASPPPKPVPLGASIKWTTTAPSRRVELLELEDQTLARELAKASELTKKEQRALTNRLFKLPAARRELIIECSKTTLQ